MKTNKFFSLAAAALCGLALTSCNEDNAVIITDAGTVTIGFEGQALNEQNFWIGDPVGNSYSYSDDWGGTTTTYTDNAYAEAGVKFPVTYNLYASEWGTSDFWSGYAISGRTETSFNMATLTPDQYNNVTGKAHTGKQFCVITTYGETIGVNDSEGVVIKKLYYTNSAYTLNSILNGDNYSGAPFDETDWFTCTITGTKADGTTASVDVELAKNGSYVSEWTPLDLSSLGKVTSLSFAFSGSRSNDYGVLTPAYICIDDVEIEVAK